MKLQRVLAVILVLCFLAAGSVPANASGAEPAGLEHTIVNACTYNTQADLSGFNLSPNQLEAVFDRLYATGKLPWYTAKNYEYTYVENGFVQKFTPAVFSAENFDMAAYEEKAAQILKACVFPGMAPWQIALSLHDYLIANTVYDETLVKNSAYDVLVNGSSVCAGYALAYRDLLQRAGVACILVTSEEMNHAWNLVCLDGNWYHVDLTWDDPTPDSAGYVSHEYFLRTDAEFSAGDEPHFGWDTEISCTDTRFSQGFWNGVYSQICYESSEICYLLRTDDWTNSIYRRDNNTTQETRIYKESVNYIDIGHGNYMYEHSGLSLYRGRLWFPALGKLLSIGTDGKDLRTEYTHSGNTYLHGSHVSHQTATLTLMDHQGTPSTHTVALGAGEEHIHSFTRTVREPTCTEGGETVSLCSCGLEAHSTPTQPLGHSYSLVEQKNPSLFEDGFRTESCDQCQHVYTQTLPQTGLSAFLLENKAVLVISAAVVLTILRGVGRKKKAQAKHR